jgi:two-component system response regulator MprA
MTASDAALPEGATMTLPASATPAPAQSATAHAMPRILVIDDEPDITSFLRRGLTIKGYEVEVAHSGRIALDAAREREPDLVILDIMLPDLDGVEVCRRLREFTNAPIIMVTARDAVPDRINGLDAGADDYVTKPFAFDELLARVRAAFRRQAQPTGEYITVGDLRIRPASREVWRGQRKIALTTREFELLEFLARNRDQVMTHETIFSRVWGYDLMLESEAIKVYVRYLRRKLNADGEGDLIQSVRGVGYMLKAPDSPA